MSSSIVYGSADFETLIRTTEKSVTESSVELKIETYQIAVVLPFAEPDDVEGDEKWLMLNKIGGVYDEHNNLIELSKIKAGENFLRVGRPECYIPDNEIKYVDEDVVFIGCLMHHFGHFILESLNRLWAYLDGGCDGKCAVYIGAHDTPFMDVLTVFGLDEEKIVKISEPTRFKSVTIPEGNS